MKTALLIFLIVNFFGAVLSSQQIVEGPVNTRAHLGQPTLLRCTVKDQVGKVFWTKNGFGLGYARSLPLYSNYQMEGSQARGEYHLRILNVTMSDDAIYQCGISSSNNSEAVRSNEAKLTVLVEPEPPKLRKDLISMQQIIAGRSFKATCESKNGKPAPQINWALFVERDSVKEWIWLGNETFSSKTEEFDNTKQSIREDAKVEEGTFTTDKKYTVISSVTFTPMPEDDGTHLICLAAHETYKRIRSTSIELDVNYAPIVKLLTNKSKLVEGQSVTIECKAIAKPSRNLKFYWYKNGTRVSTSTNRFTIPKLRLEDHQQVIKCEVENTIGITTASLVLDVSYGPRFKTPPKELETKVDETARFNCEAVGNPEPEILWKKVGSEEVISIGNDLVFKFTNNGERGEYECIAKVDGFPSIHQNYYLHLVGSPAINLTEDVPSSGGTRELICEIYNKPFPTEVSWLLNGRPVLGFTKPIIVPRKYAMVSRFVFNETKSENYGVYTCTAKNSFGITSKTIKVEQRNLLAGLFSIQYILPLIIVTVSICGILVCFWILRCRRSYYKNSTRLNDEQSDVTVKCETLDGTQFFADMCAPPPMDGRDLPFSRDYISVPQGNPDLDYIQTTECINGYSPRSKRLLEYSDDHSRYGHPYGQFSISTNGDSIVDMYGYNNMNLEVSPLEPLTEVTTPDIVTAPGLMVNGTSIIERPVSRLSTHV